MQSHAWRVIWQIMHLVVFVLIPTWLLIVGNAIISIRLIKSMQIRNQSSSMQNNVQMNRAIAVLFCITLVFLITWLPITCHNIILLNMSEYKWTTWGYYVNAILLILQFSNNSINFFLYCLTGSKLRRELFLMFRSCKQRCCSPNWSILHYLINWGFCNKKKWKVMSICGQEWMIQHTYGK